MSIKQWNAVPDGKVRRPNAGRAYAVAIKKIKVGKMKDGLDMTALREVKFLQELHHPNIIGVGPASERA